MAEKLPQMCPENVQIKGVMYGSGVGQQRIHPTTDPKLAEISSRQA